MRVAELVGAIPARCNQALACGPGGPFRSYAASAFTLGNAVTLPHELQERGKWYGPEVPPHRVLCCLTHIRRDVETVRKVVAALDAEWPLARVYAERKPDWDGQPFAIMAHTVGGVEECRLKTLIFDELNKINKGKR